jgi:transcriptional regulator with XRE-family HTH domain
MTPPALLTRPAIVEFGKRVRAFRLQARLTQEELAERAYMRRLFVRHVEQGKSNPSLGSIVLLAHGLDCSLADLFPKK